MADTNVQRQLLDHQNTWTWPLGVRLTPAVNFHLTLQFLGLVDAGAEARLVTELDQLSTEPFDLELIAPGTFDGGIAWLGPRRSKCLWRLHQQVTIAVRRAGLVAPEEWTPHVTLARRATHATPPVSTAPISWQVKAFSLLWSTEGTYRELASWPTTQALH